MSEKIIPPREVYRCDGADLDPLHANIFLRLQHGFIQYVARRTDPLTAMQTPSFQRYVGDLERACHAAKTLREDYDTGVGIAKKGLWLSYIFHLHGMNTGDVFVYRQGDKRIMRPINLHSTDVKWKKVLVFDNDLVTGKTADAVAKELRKKKAKKVDLLLIYRQTRIDENFSSMVEDNLTGAELVGMTPDGRYVYDTHANVPDSVGKCMGLDHDFEPNEEHLDELIKKLGL
ncbi:hypothetical protein KY362_02900 [Candidatus Woesearchaeota archaeon]|nr:hypothetical protein [Candidatus Woesearchaeota archaeon]